MSRDDDLNNMIDDLIERYLLFLRGRGPEPDLSVLPVDRRVKVREQLEIVAALADRETELPPIEQDPVAIRLGLVEASRSNQMDVAPPSSDDDYADDPVKFSLDDLAFRFNEQITIETAPAWMPPAPAGLEPVGRCIALGEVVAVFVANVEDWSREPETVARFFRQHPDVSTVALVTADAERAIVLTAADAHDSVDRFAVGLLRTVRRRPSHSASRSGGISTGACQTGNGWPNSTSLAVSAM